MIRTNKQMIFSVIVFTTILFGVYSYFIINHKMAFMDLEYPMWEYAKEKIHTTNDQHHNFVVLGDSRIKAAFMPENFDDDNLNSLNLSLGGSSAIEGYYSLKRYLENNEKPDDLLLAYSPGMLSWHIFYWYRTVNYQYLENDEYEEVSHLSKVLDNHATLAEADYMDVQIYTGKYFTQFLNGITDRRWSENVSMYEQLGKSKGHVFFGTDDRSDVVTVEVEDPDFIPSKILDDYFEKILVLAQQHNIKVYWYSPPLNEASMAMLTPEFNNSFNSYLQGFEGKYDLTILRTLHGLDNDNFGDQYHVYKGAPMVTQSIKDSFLAARDKP